MPGCNNRKHGCTGNKLYNLKNYQNCGRECEPGRRSDLYHKQLNLLLFLFVCLFVYLSMLKILVKILFYFSILCQVWRGALLLCDFLVHNEERLAR